MNDAIHTEVYKGFIINIHPDDCAEKPWKDMDMASIRVFNSKNETLDRDDDYHELPLLCILWQEDGELAGRIEEIVEWKARRCKTYAWDNEYTGNMNERSF